MILDLLKDPAILTLLGTCFSGLCAVAVAWINRNKPPRLPPALIPIILLLGGALSGLALGHSFLVRLLVPNGRNIEAASCGYDNCEKKAGCKCVGGQCRCGAVDELSPPIPPGQPTRKHPKKNPLPKPTSSLAVVSPVMAGRPWGWFMEPLRSAPTSPTL